MVSTGVRLQKTIAAAGLASRRAAERMIQAGQVRVNGKIVVALGTRIDPETDKVEVDGRPLPLVAKVKRVVWALYKPRGCVTTLHDPEGRRTVRDYFPRTNQRLFPVGRLAYDTEGLILLTNDGEFAQHVSHASFGCEKEYFVVLDQDLRKDDIKKLEKDIIITGFVPQNIIPKYLALADVCINPFEINFVTNRILPTKILEYLACKKPVISTPLKGTVEIIPNEKYGVKYSNSHEFIENLGKLREEVMKTMKK